jgi:hypothetical protein
MCLIIMANDLKSLNYKDLETAYDRNSNGFGVMYMNKENKFVSDKFLPKNFNDVKNFFNAHKTQTNKMAIHFRFTTEGKTNKKNCHPFISYKSDDRVIGMMHNGARLPIPLIHKNCSDTWHFNQHYLKTVFANNPNAILKDEYQKELAEHIDNDKMLFLDSKTSKFIIINESYGNYKGSNWFSNDYWDIPKISYRIDNDYNSDLNYYGFRGHHVLDQSVNSINFLSDDEISRTPSNQLYDFVDDCYYSEDLSPLYNLVDRYKKKVS